jgi:DNA-binding Lrp family transcriptional regulator
MKTDSNLDPIDESILRILSTYDEMTPLELWYELGEADALKERVTEAEVGARLESLRKKGFVERVKEAGVDGESRRPIYRITRSDIEP